MSDPMHNPSWTEQSETQQISARPLAPRHAALAEQPSDAPTEPTSEPVIIAHAVTVVLAAIVAAGWAVIPSATIDTVGSVIALVLSTVATVLARARVTPLSGGLWATIGDYVMELVQQELAKYKI